jgi:hypothetical protein
MLAESEYGRRACIIQGKERVLSIKGEEPGKCAGNADKGAIFQGSTSVFWSAVELLLDYTMSLSSKQRAKDSMTAVKPLSEKAKVCTQQMESAGLGPN